MNNLPRLFSPGSPAAVLAVVQIVVLVACGGGNASESSTPVASSCGAGQFLDGSSCQTYAVVTELRAPTPFIEDGRAVSLQALLYKPLTSGRHPTVVFHHGSTGNGSDPSLFRQAFTSETVARFFVGRGWMVVFPQRRGRGTSDGLYNEGFNTQRSAYSCEATLALAGAEHALADLDAITEWLRQLPEVDTARMLIGGTSRGGVLALAHVARRPEVYLAAVNFVGGWLGEGCGDHRSVNAQLFQSGARFAGRTLWLYAVNDTFYSLPYSRSNYASYSTAGGVGAFHEFSRASGLNGHFLISDPLLWGDVVDWFLGTL